MNVGLRRGPQGALARAARAGWRRRRRTARASEEVGRGRAEPRVKLRRPWAVSQASWASCCGSSVGVEQAGLAVAGELGLDGGVDDGAEGVDLGEEQPLRVAEHGRPQVEDAEVVGLGEVVLDAGAHEGGEGVEAGCRRR
jgi:hypothetical protein